MNLSDITTTIKLLFEFVLLQRFHAEGADVIKVDGFEMVKTMAANVEVMMQHKIDAIKVIMLISWYLDFKKAVNDF